VKLGLVGLSRQHESVNHHGVARYLLYLSNARACKLETKLACSKYEDENKKKRRRRKGIEGVLGEYDTVSILRKGRDIIWQRGVGRVERRRKKVQHWAEDWHSGQRTADLGIVRCDGEGMCIGMTCRLTLEEAYQMCVREREREREAVESVCGEIVWAVGCLM
jgi:hypothetical protein